ncbi:MAG: hypothetical protein D6781_06565 [Verrucomicrobia bacterium]|nr:MAG: hypothetical protein D6781_06565 [Verrucomicrobiota bacterium]
MHPFSTGSRRSGSALGATLIFAVAITIVVAVLLRWADNERRLTSRNLGLAKARTAAESVGAYGEAQIIARLERLVYFPDDEFLPGRNPVSLTPTASGLDEDAKILALRDDGKIKEMKLEDALKKGFTVLGQPLLPASTSSSSTAASGHFSYEVTPENLVIGRFTPARWVIVSAANPLYDGDPLVGQTIRVREVEMVSAARATDVTRGTEVRAFCHYRLQVRDVPLWGYAIFYNMALEIAPGPIMNIYGPVHSNSNAFIQSGNGLNFHEIVTVAGDLFHGRIGGNVDGRGDVTFRKAGTTNLVSLQQGGHWLSSADPDWTSKASSLWAGNVRTKDHGINKANVPGMAEYVPDDPSTPENELDNSAYALIEPTIQNDSPAYPGDEIETQKFASKACLVIEISESGAPAIYKYRPDNSGKYVRNVGNGVERFSREKLAVPPGLIVGGTADNKFYDKRRGQWVFSADIDVSRLKELIETPGAATAFTRGSATFDPSREWNGVVYVDHKKISSGGVRLVNGSAIPNRPTSANGYVKGMTFATNAPLYVQGNFNADGNIPGDQSQIRKPDSSAEPPAGLAADAITILSNAWQDANSTLDLSGRKATQTEVSAAFLLGIVPTNKNNNGRYSGGVENLPRFLENWSGVKFGYRGSMVVLFESERATEPWGMSNVYRPPNRVWGFHTLFAEGILPPGTPVSRSYRRIAFRDINENEYNALVASLSGG